MKETMHIVRWGIPGTIFFGIIFFLSIVVRVPPYPAPPLFHSINVHGYLEENALVGTVAFLIGASVPIGFIIYQIYYVWFWFGWPKSRRDPIRLFPSRGFELLMQHYIAKYQLKIIMDQEDHYIKNKLVREKGLKIVHKNHYYWIILSNIINETKDKSILTVLERWDDIFHGLGATCTSVILGSLFFVFFWILPQHQDGNTITHAKDPTTAISFQYPIDSAAASSANTTLANLSLLDTAYRPLKAQQLKVDSLSQPFQSISHMLSIEQWIQMLIILLIINFAFGLILRINRNAVIRSMSVTAKMILVNIDKTGWPEEVQNELQLTLYPQQDLQDKNNSQQTLP